MEIQVDLARGTDGCDKPLSCSTSLIAKVAETRPKDLTSLTRLLGDKRAERFGMAFLDVLAQAH
jgi:ATP-dependent DNA helicase RecQ